MHDEVKLRYRGREVSAKDLESIHRLIAEHPDTSRRRLSALLCEAWDWRQPNGELRDMVCRSLMLELHRAGLITLPPVRQRPPNNVVLRRSRPECAIDTSPVDVTLDELRPLEFEQVRRSQGEKLCEALIDEHHYLGYVQPVGEHLKYLVRGGGRVLACLAWSSAPRHLGPRDRFIGWTAHARRRNIHLLAYNTRFLVLPWVRVPHLASHILGRMTKVLAEDWERIYGHPIHYLESFVEPGRFRGTCYRAANWRFLGLTTGRGRADHTGKANRPLKEVLGYPLTTRFRELLGYDE
jgi:hypothetical protein